ncbi:hypothetical protein HZI73_09320 [Vallitalea pronyensis]|uniref:Uncharacterized protein n=1 Tax=Vallitalea pronyensis TaxID=1348613 RepID=A0A8J8MJ20_9FIRM|nr:GxGYxYP domain-containing protein [Vallitalea pronyensis]QUI22489.1 hypothetical protein HZI73_09320 [Vallitalea pronyensis]
MKKILCVLLVGVLCVYPMVSGKSTSKVYAYANGSYFIQPAYTATTLKVIDRADLTLKQRPMIAALQGLIANKTSNQIYITDSTNGDGYYQHGDAYLRWLNDLRDNYNVSYTTTTDAWSLVNQYKQYIDGYILYQDGDSSINVASSLAGVLNAIPVEASLESTVMGYGLSKVIDVRGKDEAWCKDNYWHLFNHDVIIEQKEENELCMRDFAAMHKCMVFYDGTQNSSWRTSLMQAMNDDAVIMGWGLVSGSENGFIINSGQNGVHYLPADWGKNLSVLSGFNPRTSYTQNTHTDPAYEENVHYVTFIMSDGDNLQWTLARGMEDKWWGNTARGDFDMGWSFPPSLMRLAPTVMNWHYDTASTGTGRDNFVVGPSGGGFFFPGDYPTAEHSLHLQRLNEFMGIADMNSVMLLGYNDWNNTAMFDRYTAQSNIDGLFYFEWYGFGLDTHGRTIKWSNNKPVMSGGAKLFERKNECVSTINSGSTNVYTDGAYTAVYVQAWEPNIMDNVKYVVDRLNSNVRVVTPEEMIKVVNHFRNPNNPVDPPIQGQVQVNLSSNFNADGFSYDANLADGDLAGGYAYSADLVNNEQQYERIIYQLGSFTDGQLNSMYCAGQTIDLPDGQFAEVRLLGSSTYGNKSGSFTLNYTDGTSSVVNVTMQDWCQYGSNQKIVQTMDHRHDKNANTGETITNYIFAYYLTANANKTISSIKVPQNNNMHVFAMTLKP